ncbi:MAG: UDP-N-acetylmuramoyl-L-alanine--D-glutamate ligase [Opitutus sp.]
MIPPARLQPLLAKSVAVFGGGLSGQGVCALLQALGAEGCVYDANPEKGRVFSARHASRHGLVVFSPGFAPAHPWLGLARAAGLDCLGEVDFASLCWAGRLVAVTGTNGKTTLTEFLTHALGRLGRAAHATGNTGHPLSRLVSETRGGIRDSIAVCEVSSFQAETLQHLRADATLWTNFAEDHLDRHPGLEGYFNAKWKLVEHTLPGAVLAGSSVLRHAATFGHPVSALVTVPTEGQPADPRLVGTVFASLPQLENFLLAAAWWKVRGFPPEELHAAAGTFRPGRHRLARVAQHEGISYWNDSKATNFHAVEAALAGFTAPVVLIAGGRAKGGDLAGFVHRIAPHVKHAVLIGETGAALAFHCSTFRVAHTRCASLDEAVRRATELATGGDHVLLSPGCASFDMFRSYEDRGEQFEHLVHALLRPSGAPAGTLS